MKYVIAIAAAVVVSAAWGSRAHAQACPALHHCYYVPPPFASVDESPAASSAFTLELTSVYSDTAEVEITFDGATEQLAVGRVTQTKTFSTAFTAPYDVPAARGAFISSTRALSVVLREAGGTYGDAASIKLASRALGDEFVLVGYPATGGSDFDFVSIYAPTGAEVVLTPPSSASAPFWDGAFIADTVVTEQIPAGETLIVRTTDGVDFTGTLLTADAPVTVLVGGRGGAACSDDGFDNIVPVSGLGTRHVVFGTPTVTAVETMYIVVAVENGTDVTVEAAPSVSGVPPLSPPAPLAAYETFIFGPDTHTWSHKQVRSSKPVYVVETNTAANGCNVGLAWVPPAQIEPLTSPWMLGFVTPSIDFTYNVLAGAPESHPLQLDPITAMTASITQLAELPVPTPILYPGSITGLTGGHPFALRSTYDVQLRVATGGAADATGSVMYYDFARTQDCAAASACEDGNECTTDTCIGAGFCSNSAKAARTACSTGVCNGSVIAPACVGCIDSNDCAAGATCNAGACQVSTPTLDTPMDAATVRDPLLTFSGSAAPGSTVHVMIAQGSSGPTELGTAVADPSGDWSLQPSAELTFEETYTWYAFATAGSATSADSPSRTFALTNTCTVSGDCLAATPICNADNICAQCESDTDCPSVATCTGSSGTLCELVAPAMLVPANGDVVNEGDLTFSGTGVTGATVTVFVDGAPIGTTVVAGDGTWAFTPTTSIPRGSHVMRVQQAVGTAPIVVRSPMTPAVTVSVIGDCQQTSDCPAGATCSTLFSCVLAAPVVLTPASGATINELRPTVTGTAPSGSTVAVTMDATVVGSASAASDGRWSLETTTPLSVGAHNVQATASVGALTSPFSNTNTFTIVTGCLDDDDCNGTTPYCRATSRVCVECNTNAHCRAGAVCDVSGTCTGGGTEEEVVGARMAGGGFSCSATQGASLDWLVLAGLAGLAVTRRRRRA